jgi:predicted transcriptional regulator
MSEAAPSPVVSVQVMQALVARELVEAFGLSERRAAALLGVVPSSVSQYLSGKRLGPALSAYFGDEDARRIARLTAQRLVDGAPGAKTLLGAAIAFGERFGAAAPAPGSARSGELPPALARKVPGWLRNRIVGEQNAVAECMRLAQRSRDELTRALFRQIASDSLRHAEIVASLAAYLDRGLASSPPTGITRSDIEHLIRREHEAEATSDVDLGPELGGVMRILWDSMEADERKHELLLGKLLDAADAPADRPAPRRRGGNPASR